MLPPVCNRFFELPSPLPLRKYTVINAKGVRTERRTADTSSSLQRVTSPNIFWALEISKNEALHTLYLDLRVVNQAKNQFNKKNIFFFCQQAYYLDRTSEWPGRLWRTISTTVQPPPSPPPHRSPSRTHSSCSSLHSHQQCRRVPLSPCLLPCWYFMMIALQEEGVSLRQAFIQHHTYSLF